jgi:glutamine cyclotransferase
MWGFWALVLILWGLLAPKAAGAKTPVYKAQILEEYAHDPTLFTQGLFFLEGDLVESAGLYGHSLVRRYEPGGQIKAELKFKDNVFAEGAVFANGSIIVLTWREGLVFYLDPQTLAIKETRFLPKEGWGLTFDGSKLWRSDGSARLSPLTPFLEPAGPALVVTDNGLPVRLLNELEMDPQSGLILANIWGQPLVAFIDPVTGEVKFYLDCRLLKQKANVKNPEAVLNGLALDSKGRLHLTGKLWPKTFVVDWNE